MTSFTDSAHAAAPEGQTGADVIVDYLIREKVPYIFGLCGHGNIGFIDSLYARSEAIKTVSVHHETVCGFMADVYYRVSGQPCATFTSCGPGSATAGSTAPRMEHFGYRSLQPEGCCRRRLENGRRTTRP